MNPVIYAIIRWVLMAGFVVGGILTFGGLFVPSDSSDTFLAAGLVIFVPTVIASMTLKNFILPFFALKHRQEKYHRRKKLNSLVDDMYEHREEPEQRVRCPYCAELIMSQAIICKHCGRTVGGAK